MRPLGIYFIGIYIYFLDVIHFLMILGDFRNFSLMLTDGHTDPRSYGHTDGRTDRPSYRDARTHLKREEMKGRYKEKSEMKEERRVMRKRDERNKSKEEKKHGRMERGGRKNTAKRKEK